MSLDLLEHLKILPTSAEIMLVANDVADKHYSLYYVDYRDDLNHKKYEEAADEALNNPDVPYSFDDAVYECVMDWDNWDWVRECINDVKTRIMNHYDDGEYDAEQIDDIRELLEDSEVEDHIRYLIEERDDSTPVSDLISNTRPYTLRIHLASNYECIDSPYNTRGPIEYDGYIKQLLTVLNMNPTLFKAEWEQHEYEFSDGWPDMPELNGKERVTAEALYREWRETAYASQFVILGLLDPSEFKNYTGKIKLNDATFGFFDAWNGSGSTFEENIIGEWIIDIKEPTGDSDYDRFRPHIDSQHGYSIDTTYGPTREFWGEEVTLL